jgi:hypothetical protein
MNGQLHAPVTLTPGCHWIGGWLGPRASLDVMEERKISRSTREQSYSRPARSYTDWATPALHTNTCMRI